MDRAHLASLTRRDFVAAAVLAIAVLAGASARMVPGVVGVIDDDAVYSVTARSIAEGHGYRLRNLPGEPPQTKYPVLYPAILSLAWQSGASLERNLFAMQATTTALAALALAAAYLYCVRFGVGARAAAFAGCLLAASAPNILFYCSQTLSEMPFLLFLVAALWSLEMRLRAPPGDVSRGGNFTTGVLLALPFLCRTAGAAFAIAAVAVLLWRRKPVGWVLAGLLATTLPWFLWIAFGVPADADAVVEYHTDYLGWWRTNASLVVPISNIRMAFVAFFHIDFEYLALWAYFRVAGAGWIMTALGSLPWIIAAVRSRSISPLPAMLLAYFVLLVVWPWPPDRFLVPILPFLATMLFDEIGKLAGRVRSPRTARIALGALFAGVIVTNVLQLQEYARPSRAGNYPYFMWPSLEVEWQRYQRAFAWLRENTEPGDVVASGFDTMTSLYTGRYAVRPFISRPLALFYGANESSVGDVDELEEIVTRHRARYLLLTPLPAYDQEEAFYTLVYAASDEKPGLLKPVWQLKEDPRFVIYKVGLDGGAASAPAGEPEKSLQKPRP